MMYCTKCGKQNNDAAKFCTSCGGPLTSSLPPVVQKKNNNKWIICGLILFIGLCVGSYFMFFNNNPSTSNKNGLANNDAIRLKELVHQWNAGLNKGSAADISSLYAERLVYYRAQMSKGNATVLLSNFFLKNPTFNQVITGEITFDKINDNLFVCNFLKTVTQNGKTTDFPSYLKVSKEYNEWKIVEEGDKITDYNINKNK